MKKLVFLMVVLLTSVVFADDDPIYDLHEALWRVESSRSENPPDGDGGRAIGPFQIWEAYWIDATEYDDSLTGDYQMCREWHYALMVMHAYWGRYCPDALENRDLETLARVHNGGPRGAEREITDKYWDKVKQELANIREGK